jgi:hypothetical protein
VNLLWFTFAALTHVFLRVCVRIWCVGTIVRAEKFYGCVPPVDKFVQITDVDGKGQLQTQVQAPLFPCNAQGVIVSHSRPSDGGKPPPNTALSVDPTPAPLHLNAAHTRAGTRSH